MRAATATHTPDLGVSHLMNVGLKAVQARGLLVDAHGLHVGPRLVNLSTRKMTTMQATGQ